MDLVKVLHTNNSNNTLFGFFSTFAQKKKLFLFCLPAEVFFANTFFLIILKKEENKRTINFNNNNNLTFYWGLFCFSCFGFFLSLTIDPKHKHLNASRDRPTDRQARYPNFFCTISCWFSATNDKRILMADFETNEEQAATAADEQQLQKEIRLQSKTIPHHKHTRPRVY